MNNSIVTAAQVRADDEDRWIDVHNHDLMVGLGMRQPLYRGRSLSVWEKTPEERKQLEQLKARCTTILPRQWPYTKTRKPFYAKLIVKVRPTNKYKFVDKHGNTQKKTTFSHKSVCVSDITSILSKYYVWKDKARQSIVISYNWNGKEYAPNELPYVGR